MKSFSECLPGKTKRTFLHPQEISKHLICPVCYQCFQDPQRLSCGHTFCCVCILTWCSVSKRCPSCNQEVNRKLQKDLIASSMVDDLLVKCSHQGCHWEGVYSLSKKHQRLCNYRHSKGQEQPNLIQLPQDFESVQIHNQEPEGQKIEQLRNLEKKQNIIQISDTQSEDIVIVQSRQ